MMSDCPNIKYQIIISDSRQITETSLLRFSLVFVTALGFADAVLSLPVQDLLELFLLPADAIKHQIISK